MLNRKEIGVIEAVRALSDDQRAYLERVLFPSKKRVKRVERINRPAFTYLIEKASLKRR